MNGDRGKPSEVEIPPGDMRSRYSIHHSPRFMQYAVTGKKVRISYSHIFSSFLFFSFLFPYFFPLLTKPTFFVPR